MVNVERLREVVARIEENPDAWDQSVWGEVNPQCGTVACIAGHTALMFAPSRVFWERCTCGADGCDSSYLEVSAGDSAVTVSNLAGDLLGLDNKQRYYLFKSRRPGRGTINDLKIYIMEAVDDRSIWPEVWTTLPTP